MPVDMVNLFQYGVSILLYIILFTYYFRRGELENNGKLMVLAGSCFGTGFSLFDGVNQIIWAVIIFEMYNDLTTHTIILTPLRMGTVAMTMGVLIAVIIQWDGWYALSVLADAVPTVVFIYGLSIIGFYASGDAEVFVLLIMSRMFFMQKYTMAYFLILLWISSLIFVMELTVINIVEFIISRVKKRRYKLIRRAAMLPAITTAYLLLFYAEVNSVHLCI